MKKFRFQTGLGFDSHLFSRTGTLVLGGRHFSGVPALKGHSDGDVILHAAVDALLGAASLGDIGQLFPDTDASIKGISSRVMIRKAMSLLATKKIRPVHIDFTVVLEKPKLAPHNRAIRDILADLLNLPVDRVSLKAKTPEGLNFFKAPGGVAVWAIATVQIPA